MPRSHIGFFGKLPSHGDFVRRAFPSELGRRWDGWLQTGLAASREALGDDWLECYLSSPIWRFCISSGICGEAQWIGAMMPSVDRVGRYFPLTAVAEAPVSRSLFGTAAIAESWFSALEKTMLSALEEDSLTAEELLARLAAQEPLGADEPPITDTEPHIADREGFIAVQLTSSAHLDDAAGLLADALARRTCGGFSLWWSSGSEHVPPSARIYTDLPPAELFWTLFHD